MAQVYGSQSQYLIKNEKVNRRISKLSLFTLVFASGIVAGFTIDLFGKDFDSGVKIILFLIISSAFFYISWRLLLYYSKHEAVAKNYQTGFEGEELAFHELVKLPDDHIIFRDVVLGKGNIDFIVVRPNEIFCIEVKSHMGSIGFNGQNLTRNGYTFKEGDLITQTWLEGKDTKEFLQTKLMQNVPVIPILVFSNPKAWIENKYTVPVKYGVYVMNLKILNNFILKYRRSSVLTNIPAITAFLQSHIKK